MKDIKEKYLLFRAKNLNDAEAYGQIYDIYASRIYRFIYFKIGSKQDAEDIASETFLKAWQYIQDGQAIKNLNAFLYSIARNSVIDHYRKQAKKRDFEEAITVEIKVNSDIVQKIDLNTSEEKLLNALRSLKDEYSEVLILRFFDDLSVGETAQIINKSSNNTRVLVHRALGALRKILETT